MLKGQRKLSYEVRGKYEFHIEKAVSTLLQPQVFLVSMIIVNL